MKEEAEADGGFQRVWVGVVGVTHQPHARTTLTPQASITTRFYIQYIPDLPSATRLEPTSSCSFPHPFTLLCPTHPTHTWCSSSLFKLIILLQQPIHNAAPRYSTNTLMLSSPISPTLLTLTSSHICIKIKKEEKIWLPQQYVMKS